MKTQKQYSISSETNKWAFAEIELNCFIWKYKSKNKGHSLLDNISSMKELFLKCWKKSWRTSETYSSWFNSLTVIQQFMKWISLNLFYRKRIWVSAISTAKKRQPKDTKWGKSYSVMFSLSKAFWSSWKLFWHSMKRISDPITRKHI